MPWNPVPGVRVVTLAKAALVAVIACVACGLIGAGVGAWAGIEWQQGRQAQADNQKLREDATALRDAALEIRQSGIDITTDFRTAARRMDVIAQENERAAQEDRQFYQDQTRELAQLLRARPDLDAVDVGPGLLCHWNRNLQGATGGAAAPAPGCAGEPARPAAAPAAGQRRSPANAAGKPAAGGRGVQRLPAGSRGSDQGGSRVRGDSLGVVLPRAGSDRRDRRGLHERREA